MPRNRAKKVTAVERVASKFGSLTALGEVCGVSRSTVCHWNRPATEKNGRGGAIPDVYFPKIMAAAKKRKIPFDSNELLNL